MTEQRRGKQTVVTGFTTVEEHDEHDGVADYMNAAAPQHGSERTGAHERTCHHDQRPENRTVTGNRMPLRTMAGEQ